MTDTVNHPPHYRSHPSGVECIQITRHMNFNLGNAVKYIWRAGLKNDAVEDLRKATFYIADEIARLQPSNTPNEGLPFAAHYSRREAERAAAPQPAPEGPSSAAEAFVQGIGAGSVRGHLAARKTGCEA